MEGQMTTVYNATIINPIDWFTGKWKRVVKEVKHPINLNTHFYDT